MPLLCHDECLQVRRGCAGRAMQARKVREASTKPVLHSSSSGVRGGVERQMNATWQALLLTHLRYLGKHVAGIFVCARTMCEANGRHMAGIISART